MSSLRAVLPVVAAAILCGAGIGCNGGTASDGPSTTPGRDAGSTPRSTERAASGVDAKPPGPLPFRFRHHSPNLPTEGKYKCDPLLVDLNGDGKLDLVGHPRLGKGPRVWFGDGAGGWSETSEGLQFAGISCGGGIAAADLNRDGHQDLVIADHCSGVYVYFGDGAGNWENVAVLTAARLAARINMTEEIRGTEDVKLGDVNGDGHLDIVAASSDKAGVIVFHGDGTGRNWEEQETTLPARDWVNRVALADVNGDGRLDIVATQAVGPRVYLNDGKGGWTPSSYGLPTPSIGGLFYGLAVGDVNEDGRPDVVVANWVNGPEVFLQQTDGTWGQTTDIFPQMHGGSVGLALADLDGDGQLDLLTTGRLPYRVGYVHGIFALKGMGAPGWVFVPGCGLPETGLAFCWGIGVGDVNGDGIADVAVGGGGMVGEDFDRKEPVIPAGIMVFLGERPE